MSAFADFVSQAQPKIEATLESLLPPASEAPEVLHCAMRHSMFPGGKRLRPVLTLLASRVCGGDWQNALRPAVAMECLHTYSLIHDDLPCMDDDELRRGRPTCHVAFGEANAVLAGDALQALAFEAVADAGAAAVVVLARAAGSLGMVGGQAGDMEAESRTAELEQVRWIHDRKTGALITASLEIGAIAAGAPEAACAVVRRYGSLIGRAFQIADDVLDLTGAAEDLGKRPGQDLTMDKATYPSLLGIEESRVEAERLSRAAADLAPELCAAAGLGTGVDDAVRLLEDTALFLSSRSR